MAIYIRNQNRFNVLRDDDVDLVNELPVGTYTVGLERTGFYLDRQADFQPLGKYYGDIEEKCERILSTYNDRPRSTGVMLTGEKGSGKTLLAKLVSIRAREMGMSTINITTAFSNGDEEPVDLLKDAFFSFLKKIDQPVVIIFDEFEKMYKDKAAQQGLLSFFDGTFEKKNLFMLTCNNKWDVDENLRNRPGRIYYMIDYEGLDRGFVKEYATDHLNDKDQVNSVCTLCSIFRAINFDMLQSIIEEMNRYGLSAAEAMELLNAKPSQEYRSTYETSYDVEIFREDRPVFKENVRANPLAKPMFSLHWWDRESEDNDHHETTWDITTDLVSLDELSGQFEMVNKEGIKAVVTTLRPSYSDYKHLL